MNDINYLFSRSPKIGSKLISWGSNLLSHDLPKNKVPSHVAVLLDGTIVIESTMTTGVRLIPYKQWKEINEELYKIPHKHSKNCEDLEDLLYEVWGKNYDHLGVCYFALKSLCPSVTYWKERTISFVRNLQVDCLAIHIP
jgi:hypothetical protein